MPSWVSSSSVRQRQSRDLITGFTSIRDLLDGAIQPGSLANVIGLIRDCRLPIKTKGADYKAMWTIYDLSTQHDGDTLDINIFWPLEHIPDVGAGDAVLVKQAKVQRFKANALSLITASRTVIHVFAASRILRPPNSARSALLPSKRHKEASLPTDKECDYISIFYHSISKDDLPDDEQFKTIKIQSLNVKDKFALLQDVRDGKFHDLVVQVVRDPFDLGDKITLYVSDYTENSSFFNYTWEGVRDLDLGESHGYGSQGPTSSGKQWIGPYGKKAMQVTCYEPHASYIRSEVKVGSWIELQNVQMKFGRNGAYLEGYLREDQNARSHRIRVRAFDISDEDNKDPRLKKALRRCRDYLEQKKADLERLKTDEFGSKRKREEPEKKVKNTRQRRKEKREQAQARNQLECRKEQALDLNPLVTSESMNTPITTVEDILEPIIYEPLVNGEVVRIPLPFVCRKYRAAVRVVDFRPCCLEDFACRHRVPLCDHMFSDDENESNTTDSPATEDEAVLPSRLVWEWRFMLQLEDAAPKTKEPSRFWVVVDNASAQYLTDLDASDLRQDTETLAKLREKLFTLWGDLEERKSREIAARKAAAAAKKRRPDDMPPLDSSDDDDVGHRDTNADGKGKERAFSNKPFSCCIMQYGLKAREDNPALVDAGAGKKWVRMYGLFGTRICS
ncbi:hypothetical protein VTK73DRAFT_7068 [Phialemonium thermophilum]|uniref:Protection of telomeres protein 1 n=1 Tax=Phialemonium thermophilum TaxID=223376 RepID=A0ABR3WGI5_9PEZI